MQPSGPAAAYTTLPTVWLMILQRPGGRLSMHAVVKDAIAHRPEIFPDCKRVREASLSTKDTKFSSARGQLGIDTVRYLPRTMSGSLIDASASPETSRCSLSTARR